MEGTYFESFLPQTEGERCIFLVTLGISCAKLPYFYLCPRVSLLHQNSWGLLKGQIILCGLTIEFPPSDSVILLQQIAAGGAGQVLPSSTEHVS